MRLYEYESKQLLSSRGIRVPRGVVVRRGEDLAARLHEAGLLPPVVLKSQVLVGGRGKAGGVVKASSLEEAVEAARVLFEKPIRGERPAALLVEEAVEHSSELYASVAVDRAARRPVVLASSMGGVDIEEVAREKPEAIARLHVDPWLGLRGFEARKLGKAVGLRGRLLREFESLLLSLYKVFEDYDCVLAEINPVAVTSEGLVALDAKVIIDDDALWRHPGLSGLRGDYTGFEAKARKMGFSFVELDGYVGVVGNGAGLTMATMDLVYERGGRPANFLDVGGGASAERVREALLLLNEYPKAKSVVMNIFGGITRCDEVARGVVEALEEGFSKPLAVRLSGTKEEEGRRLLRSHGVEAYADPVEAVDAAVRAAKRGGEA